MDKQNSNSAWIWIAIIIIVIILIGVLIYHNSGSGAATNQSSTAGQTSVQTQSGAPMIPYYTLAATTSAPIGTHLMAANGMTLYVYGNDRAGVSNCTGTCALQWPPYTVASSTPLNESSNVTGNISSITRTDGTTQVTYNGMPLYFFENDADPGNTNGNNVNDFVVARP